MNTALALLMAAMSLLTTVSHSPNISDSLRSEAIQIADTAISFAQSQLQTPVTTMTESGTITPQPLIVGSTLPINTPIVENTPTASILVNGQSEVTASKGYIPYISWNTTGVLDNSCSINFTTPDGGHTGDALSVGNFGINGNKKFGPFNATSTIVTLTCGVPVTDTNPSGKIIATATIHVE